MKILIVTPYFPPRKGGLEHYAYNIAYYVSKNGHKVTVITTRETKEEILDNIKVIRVENRISISNTPINIHLPFKISEVLKMKDIVNAHMPVPFCADMAAIVSKKNSIPFILTYHNDVVKDEGPLKILSSIYNRSLLQFTLRVAKKIITPSPYVYNESTIIHKFSDKTVWIPPGVDVNAYKPGKSNAKTRYNLS